MGAERPSQPDLPRSPDGQPQLARLYFPDQATGGGFKLQHRGSLAAASPPVRFIRLISTFMQNHVRFLGNGNYL